MSALPTTAQARAWLVARGWKLDEHSYDEDNEDWSIERWSWKVRLHGCTVDVPTDERETAFAALMAYAVDEIAFAAGGTRESIGAAMLGTETEHAQAQALYVDTFDVETWADAWAQALTSKDPVAAIELVCAMSDICEDHSCASWMQGWGADLAHYVSDIESRCVERISDFGQVERADARIVLALSERCGGWWEQSFGEGRIFICGWVPVDAP